MTAACRFCGTENPAPVHKDPVLRRRCPGSTPVCTATAKTSSMTARRATPKLVPSGPMVEAILAADEVMRRARVIACSFEERLIDKADVFRLIGTLRLDRPVDAA